MTQRSFELPVLDQKKPVDHAAAAARFTADVARTDWHDDALWFVREKRDRAAGSVPDWEELRNRASSIKEHALSHLDEYLVQFEANAVANGMHVHWARDADEHNRIVHGILSAAGARRLVKSKSMLTEECGLNPYLESRGIEVVDSDLGERIVQLREEGPSHIVLPAIHLRKEEVGETFHEHLGTPAGLSDPVALRASSRRKTGRSSARGITFSIPTEAMCTGASAIPRSAFPSFVQTTNPPVSATAKFIPVSVASAARKCARRCSRAAPASATGSARPAGVPRCS